MKVNKLKLTNFKSFEDAEFNFKDLNIISGQNGSGKTAIKDAIIFGLYGMQQKGVAKDTDTLIKTGADSASVEVHFDGMKMTRIKSKTASKVLFDDKSQEEGIVAQRDLIGNTIPEPDYFLSVFNSGYFMNEMSEDEQREFIMKLTPPIDRKELFLKAGGDEKLCEALEIDITDFQEAFNKSKELRYKSKKDIEAFRAQANFIRGKLKEEKVDKLEEEVNKNQKMLTLLENDNKSWNEYELAEASRAPVIMRNSKNKRLIEERQKRLDEIKLLETPDISFLQQLEEKMNELRPLELPEDVCPTCFQAITDEHRTRIDSENEKREKEYSRVAKEYGEERAKIEDVEVRQRELIKEKTSLQSEIKFMQDEFEEFREAPKPERVKPDSEAIKKLQENIFRQKELLKDKGQLEELMKQISELSENYHKFDALCNLFGPSGLPSVEAEQKVKPIEEALAKYVKGAKLIIMRLRKNMMEYYDTFDIELDGRRYERLSAGERKLLDISLSLVFDKFLKVGMIFVDDADLLDTKGIEKIKRWGKEVQMFSTHVANNSLSIK